MRKIMVYSEVEVFEHVKKLYMDFKQQNTEGNNELASDD